MENEKTIPQLREWSGPQGMETALMGVYGKSFDTRSYLYSGFHEVAGQRDYSAWLFAMLMWQAFKNYAHLAPTLSDRRDVLNKLYEKFDDCVRACVAGEVDAELLTQLRTAFNEYRDDRYL